MASLYALRKLRCRRHPRSRAPRASPISRPLATLATSDPVITTNLAYINSLTGITLAIWTLTRGKIARWKRPTPTKYEDSYYARTYESALTASNLLFYPSTSVIIKQDVRQICFARRSKLKSDLNSVILFFYLLTSLSNNAKKQLVYNFHLFFFLANKN